MKKNNLIFIGMPAVGKSTVGVVVAKRLGKNFIDTDLLIQEQEKKLLREIIAEVGEDGFLEIENQVNREEALSIVRKRCSIIKRSERWYIYRHLIRQ